MKNISIIGQGPFKDYIINKFLKKNNIYTYCLDPYKSTILYLKDSEHRSLIPSEDSIGQIFDKSDVVFVSYDFSDESFKEELENILNSAYYSSKETKTIVLSGSFYVGYVQELQEKYEKFNFCFFPVQVNSGTSDAGAVAGNIEGITIVSKLIRENIDDTNIPCVTGIAELELSISALADMYQFEQELFNSAEEICTERNIDYEEFLTLYSSFY